MYETTDVYIRCVVGKFIYGLLAPLTLEAPRINLNSILRDLVGLNIRHGFLEEFLTKLLSIPRQ